MDALGIDGILKQVLAYSNSRNIRLVCKKWKKIYDEYVEVDDDFSRFCWMLFRAIQSGICELDHHLLSSFIDCFWRDKPENSDTGILPHGYVWVACAFEEKSKKIRRAVTFGQFKREMRRLMYALDIQAKKNKIEVAGMSQPLDSYLNAGLMLEFTVTRSLASEIEKKTYLPDGSLAFLDAFVSTEFRTTKFSGSGLQAEAHYTKARLPIENLDERVYRESKRLAILYYMSKKPDLYTRMKQGVWDFFF